MVIPDQQVALHKKGRLKLAIQAYQQDEIRSYKSATTTYDIVENTVQHCISRILPKRDSIAKNCFLIPIEE